jgi:hypothetical protein
MSEKEYLSVGRVRLQPMLRGVKSRSGVAGNFDSGFGGIHRVTFARLQITAA